MTNLFPKHIKTRLPLFFSITLLLFSFCLSKPAFSQHSIGLIIGSGSEKLGTIVDLGFDYKYRVKFHKLQYNYTFWERRTWSLDAVGILQLNTSKYLNTASESNYTQGYELGFNVGVALRKRLYKDYLSCYALLSTGPHYISGAPTRQIDGFIFSDNLFIGFDIKLVDNIYLNIRPGFRHISNAETRHPNLGINSFALTGGIIINLTTLENR
mgnify:CR=1 FL=1|jgi:hypothetical protein